MSKGLSRRELFSFWRKPPPSRDPPPPRRAQPRLRPPGALDEASFLDTCERCGKCIEVCPRQALGPVAAGVGAGTPFLVPRQAPCVVCTGLQCTHACPTGALTPLVDPLTIRMGTAVIATDRCLAYLGQPCAACVDICPIPGAIAAVPWSGSDGKGGGNGKVPLVSIDRCVGCGLCENFCPPEPAAIVIRPAPR